MRENGTAIRATWPIASHGYIEDEVKTLVKRPTLGSHIAGLFGGKQIIIDVPADFIGFPLNCKDMEFGIEIFLDGLISSTCRAVVGPIFAKLDGTIHVFGLFANPFHDVNFATFGPGAISIVGGHHPEGGPNALTNRQFDAGFHATISKITLVDGANPGGSVGIATKILAFGGDFQQTTGNGGVFRAVVFQLVVAPAATASLMAPFLKIQGAAIKFVRPNKFGTLCLANCRSKCAKAQD